MFQKDDINPISEEQIYQAMTRMSKKKASSWDLLPTNFVSECIEDKMLL